MRPIDADRMKEELLWGNAFLSAKEINALVDLIDNQPTLTPPNEWISVEERVPEHLKDVIALYGNGRIDIDWVDSSGDFKFGSLFDGVTHWMPLPASPDCRPPEGEGNA